MYWLSDEDRPAYMQSDDQSLSALAKASGEHPAETWIRYQLDSDGRGVFHVRFFNLDLEALPGFLKGDWMLPGIGDAGAHVSFIMYAGWPTFVLSYWHRDRAVFTLEESIRMITSGPMRVIGFTVRVSLEVGKKADVNVVYIDRPAERQPELVHDFPGGAPHLVQKAVGNRNTIVNGEVILENDELTGARGGRILRNALKSSAS